MKTRDAPVEFVKLQDLRHRAIAMKRKRGRPNVSEPFISASSEGQSLPPLVWHRWDILTLNLKIVTQLK